MKKKIAGWILLVWGGLGLLANLVTWLPYVTMWDLGVFIVNSFFCAVFIIVGIVLVKKDKKKVKYA